MEYVATYTERQYNKEKGFVSVSSRSEDAHINELRLKLQGLYPIIKAPIKYNDLSDVINNEIENEHSFVYIKSPFWTPNASASTENQRKVDIMIERINEISSINEIGAPNNVAKILALHSIKHIRLFGVPNPLINPTLDESILFEFFVGNDKFNLEFFNDGEIIFLTKKDGEPIQLEEISSENIKEKLKLISLAYERANV